MLSRLLSVPVFLIAFSCLCMAQTDYNKGEVFGGYTSHVYLDDPGPLITVSTRGFSAAAVYNVHRYWGIKADVSLTASGTYSESFVPGFDNPDNLPVSYRQKLYLNTFTAGVQLKDNAEDQRFKPFAHALVGVGKLRSKVTEISCTTPSNCTYVPPNVTHTGFALILGGGLDIKVNKHLMVRAVQLDVSGVTGSQSPSYFSGGTSNFRFASGLVLTF